MSSIGAHFDVSVQSVGQLIIHGNTLVNGEKVFHAKIIVNERGLIEASSNVNNIVKQNVLKSRSWLTYASHLEASCKILNTFLIDEIYTKIFYSFPVLA
jgi:ribosomal protein S4